MVIEVPEALRPLLADAVLLSGIVVLLVLSLVPATRAKAGDVALLVFAATAVGAVASMDAAPGWLVERMLAGDPFATFFKFVLATCAMGEVWICTRSLTASPAHWVWSWVALATSLAGMFAMVAAENVVAAWSGLAVAGMGSALWMGWRRGSAAAVDEAAAALLQTTAASATALLGFALLFGLTGTLEYAGLGAKLPLALAMPGGRVALMAGIVLVLGGLAARLAVVAWHPWRADVGERSPVAVSAWLETAGAIAALAMIARFLRAVSVPVEADGAWRMLPGVDWTSILAVAAMIAMTMGNAAALRATNAKRLVAWLSVAQSGYLLAALALATDGALRTLLFHAVAYALMAGGALATLAPLLERDPTGSIDVLRGLARERGSGRVLAASMVVAIMSFAAVPLLAGYPGRAALLADVVRAEPGSLRVLGAVASVASALGTIACLRVVAMLFERRPAEAGAAEAATDADALLLVALLAAGTIGIGVWPQALEAFAARSVVFFGG